MSENTSSKTNVQRGRWLVSAFALAAAFVFGIAMHALMASCEKNEIRAEQAVIQDSKVVTATNLLKAVGFANPEYLGIQPGTEGKYPTFRAQAIGGKTIELFIRTPQAGVLEIRPKGLFESISSAADLAKIADEAVSNWENMPAHIKPRTDGASGEYELRESKYEMLSKYAIELSKPVNVAAGWPQK